MSQREDILYAVESMARRIFRECGAEDDFCIQYVSDVAIVFGGTNRLVLNRWGWQLDREYCTPNFIKAFDARSN